MTLIRLLRPEDISMAAALERECFSEPWSAEAFREAVENPSRYYLAAEQRGRIIGICGMQNIAGEGQISNVAVASDYRRHLTAFHMLEKLLLIGQEAGVAAFTLEVRESNEAAIRLYQKLGFAVEGIRRNFYEKPRENALILWKR